MKILLGTLPIGQGEVKSIQEFSDGTVRLAFKLVSGKDATLLMSKDEAEAVFNDLAEIFHGVK